MTARKPPEEHLPRGRPTKYKEEYCEKLLEFFDVPYTIEKERKKIDKEGNEIVWYEEVANKLPTFEGFAVRVANVHLDTLNAWKNAKDENGDLINPNFSEAYKKAKNMQKEMINHLAMIGLYNAAYTKFVAINITDMKDIQRQEISGADGEPINMKYELSPATADALKKQREGREVIDD